MKNKIRVFEAFAGYGSQSMALRRLGIDFEVIGISEIDKYAIQAYMAVHGDTPNYGDISKIDWSSVPDFDFLTYSFPCTDISTAGQQKGLAEGSGTRSSLLWECRKAIEAKRPKYLLMENVKNLVSKKFTPYLKEWIRFLEGQGYSNYTKVLNAKDFGVPQNRERVFMVSILGEVSFHFPKPFTLEKRLKDVLEKDVDESFYLSEKVVNTLLARNEKNKAKGNGFKFAPKTGDVIASSITAHPNDRPCDNFIKEPITFHIGNIYGDKKGRGFAGNVYDKDGISPTIMTNGGGNRQPMIFECCNQERKYGNKRVQSLVDSGKISGHEVQFLDAYNQKVSDICGTIKTTVDTSNMSFISEPKTKRIGIINSSQDGVVIDTDGIAKCLTSGHFNTPKIIESNHDPKIIQSPRGFNKGALFSNCPAITSSRWQDNNFLIESEKLSDDDIKRLNDVCVEVIPLNPDEEGLCRTIKSQYYKNSKSNFQRQTGSMAATGVTDGYRIRKLTPRECFRLMGVSEKDIDNIQKSGISKTQQYKMAGNSIVVDVLYYIFKKMFVDKSCEDTQLSIF